MSRNIRLLSLDGGGVRGLSSLLILKHLMWMINQNDPPKPCEFFDMIGGTSTGGLIALMLGRLKMNVQECIDAYIELSQEVFQTQKSRDPHSLAFRVKREFDSSKLERIIKAIIRRQGYNEDELLQDVAEAHCKVFVCKMSKKTGDPVLLTSYRSPRGSEHLFSTTKIWQAGRATSAASSFFDRIRIGPLGESFVDGGLGSNNPVFDVWNEARALWPSEDFESTVQCLISIGTGIPSLAAFGSQPSDMVKSIIKIATDTEGPAQRFQSHNPRLDQESRYFRFNVVRGLDTASLEEWNETGTIGAATGQYVGSPDVQGQMRIATRSTKQSTSKTAQEPRLQIPSDRSTNTRLPTTYDNRLKKKVPESEIEPVAKADIKSRQVRLSQRSPGLVEGIHTNVQAKLYGGNLYRAFYQGDEEAVHMLINADADVNTKLGNYGDPLQAACVRGWETIVQLLLDHGADVNLIGGEYGNALQAACFQGSETIVQTLLDHGAYTNARGGRFRNALAAAMDRGYLVIVQMLIDSGADVNAMDALQDAAARALQADDWVMFVSRLEICVVLEDVYFSGGDHTTGHDVMAQSALTSSSELDDHWDPEHEVFIYRWEIPAIIKSWLDNAEDQENHVVGISHLWRNVTITGKDANFEAMSCEEYLQRHYPGLHDQVRNLIDEALMKVGEYSVVRRDLRGEGSNDIAVCAFESHLCVLVSDTHDLRWLQVREIFQWLCQAVRRPHSTGLQVSRCLLIAECEHQSFGLSYSTLRPLEPLSPCRKSACWMEMFEQGVVAEKDLGRISGGYQGIEMSFELMVSLAAVETYQSSIVSESCGLVLLGFFTALVPMRSNESAIQFHFEFSQETTLKLSDLEPQVHLTSPTDFSDKRCFIGIWPETKIMLGTKSCSYEIGISGLKAEPRTLRSKGYEFTAGIQIAGGPVQAISQGTKSWEYEWNKHRFRPSSTYAGALQIAAAQVALVYDSETRLAWLVPQLSLLLHLCHVYYIQLGDGQPNQQTDPIPWAEPSSNGAEAARKAFTNAGDILIGQYGSDPQEDMVKLRHLLININANLRSAPRQFIRSSAFGSKTILGSEIIDQLCEPGAGADLKLFKAERSTINAWAKLVDKVDSVLVCAAFGQAIDCLDCLTGGGASTLAQSRLPKQPGPRLLIADVASLQKIVKEGSGLSWSATGPSIVHKDAESCWKSLEQMLQQIQPSESQRPSTQTGTSSIMQGAAIFGQPLGQPHWTSALGKH